MSVLRDPDNIELYISICLYALALLSLMVLYLHSLHIGSKFDSFFSRIILTTAIGSILIGIGQTAALLLSMFEASHYQVLRHIEDNPFDVLLLWAYTIFRMGIPASIVISFLISMQRTTLQATFIVFFIVLVITDIVRLSAFYLHGHTLRDPVMELVYIFANLPGAYLGSVILLAALRIHDSRVTRGVTPWLSASEIMAVALLCIVPIQLIAYYGSAYRASATFGLVLDEWQDMALITSSDHAINNPSETTGRHGHSFDVWAKGVTFHLPKGNKRISFCHEETRCNGLAASITVSTDSMCFFETKTVYVPFEDLIADSIKALDPSCSVPFGPVSILESNKAIARLSLFFLDAPAKITVRLPEQKPVRIMKGTALVYQSQIQSQTRMDTSSTLLVDSNLDDSREAHIGAEVQIKGRVIIDLTTVDEDGSPQTPGVDMSAWELVLVRSEEEHIQLASEPSSRTITLFMNTQDAKPQVAHFGAYAVSAVEPTGGILFEGISLGAVSVNEARGRLSVDDSAVELDRSDRVYVLSGRGYMRAYSDRDQRVKISGDSNRIYRNGRLMNRTLVSGIFSREIWAAIITVILPMALTGLGTLLWFRRRRDA